jgi:hypothetical protein
MDINTAINSSRPQRIKTVQRGKIYDREKGVIIYSMVSEIVLGHRNYR